MLYRALQTSGLLGADCSGVSTKVKSRLLVIRLLHTSFERNDEKVSHKHVQGFSFSLFSQFLLYPYFNGVNYIHIVQYFLETRELINGPHFI